MSEDKVSPQAAEPAATTSPPPAKSPPETPAAPPWLPILIPLLPVAGFGSIVILCWGLCFGFPCMGMAARYGLWIDRCPADDLRLGSEVQAYGLIREGKGTVNLRAYARYLEGDGGQAHPVEGNLRRGFSASFVLLDGEDKPVDGLIVESEGRSGSWHNYTVELPDVPDDDYIVRATVKAPFETVSVDVPLALYAPALAHVATDRPLYKPGQDVKIRSVLLRRTDLSPIDGRPGRWRIRAPNGDEMMVEKDRAGGFGIADTEFPLDDRAVHGTWKAIWESGSARDEVNFDVRPFKLPRFTVELEPSLRWFGHGDDIVVDGTARYSSGAPVADASVQVRVGKTEGRWPPPLAWEETIEVQTDAHGRFEVDMGKVPSDLIELAKLSMSAKVTEAAGEVATGAVTLVLSEDDLMVDAVTELGDGLVGGFNNRAYLRVLTPDGKAVRNADVVIENPWDPTQKKREAKSDADGVLAIQLDPGEPVTVRIPGVPSRYRALVPDPPYISSAQQMGASRSLSMDERRAFDRAVPAVALCGDFAPGGRNVSLGLRVSAAGVVQSAISGDDQLSRCVVAATKAVRLPAGPVSTYTITWYVTDSQRPSVSASLTAAHGSAPSVVMNDAALRARRCVKLERGSSGATLFKSHWRVNVGSTAIDWGLYQTPGRTGLNPTELGCIKSALQSAALVEPAKVPALGVGSFSLSVPRGQSLGGASASSRTGYELGVAATVDGQLIGKTRHILNVGAIPQLRMRATPSLAKPGDEIVVELLRGPGYRGEIPEELYFYEGTREVAEVEVDQKKRTATFTIPDDVEGFVRSEYNGARTIIFVEPTDRLSVGMSTDKPAYSPGETAKLTVTTKLGEAPTEAAVSLSGVDSTLGQLVTLLGPDDFGRVTVRAEADKPAFSSFDPRALALGQIRGENAAKAAVLRITNLPADYAGDAGVSGNAVTMDNDVEVLTMGFYRALEHLTKRVGKWEKEAPEGDTMSPELMVSLWNEALADGMAGEHKPVDAFGRELTVDLLPQDLLVQLNPRNVVRDGVRLSEDVVDWQRYVNEEVSR